MKHITYTHDKNKHYSESGQANKIRWVPLRENDTGRYENQCNLFRCRDYFNDFVVYARLKVDFSCYGMKASDVLFDEQGGLSIALCNINKDVLEHNINAVLAPAFAKLWGAVMVFDPDVTITGNVLVNLASPLKANETGILYLPAEFLLSTYRISLITLMIRELNNTKKWNSFEEFIHQDVVYKDTWMNSIHETFHKPGFVFPEAEKYVFYHNKDYNSSTHPTATGNVIHDCGVLAWKYALTGENAFDMDDEEEENE